MRNLRHEARLQRLQQLREMRGGENMNIDRKQLISAIIALCVLVGCILLISANLIIRKIDPDSSLT